MAVGKDRQIFSQRSDYVVIQPDGYVYINPKKVFEDKFVKVEEQSTGCVVIIDKDAKISDSDKETIEKEWNSPAARGWIGESNP